MHTHGSLSDPTASHSNFRDAFVGGVSRETTTTTMTFVGGGFGRPKQGFGFSNPPAPAAMSGTAGPPGVSTVPQPRAMADGAVSEPTSAMPVYEASGGPNTIVSAAGHRGPARAVG